MPRAKHAPRILLTGFEPFDGEGINPSWEVARRLHGQRIEGAAVDAVCLPCVFAQALPALQQALARVQPVLAVALGLAGSRGAISVERVAINLIDARIADNAGAQPIDQPVQRGGRAAWFSTLPVKTIVAGIQQRGIPAELSFSAGSFVCNQVFYGLMAALARRAGRTPPVSPRAGFIHLPPLPQQAARHPGSATLPLDQQVEAIRLALALALTTEQDALVSGGRVD